MENYICKLLRKYQFIILTDVEQKLGSSADIYAELKGVDVQDYIVLVHDGYSITNENEQVEVIIILDDDNGNHIRIFDGSIYNTSDLECLFKMIGVNKPIIKWESRYSDTMEDDKFGRWQRIAYGGDFSDIEKIYKIAIIKKSDVGFVITPYFPFNNFQFMFTDLEQAKSYVEEIFTNFINCFK